MCFPWLGRAMRRGGCICCRRAAGSRRTPYSFRFCMFLGLHSFLRMFSFVPHGVRHGWRFLGDGLAGRGRPFFFFFCLFKEGLALDRSVRSVDWGIAGWEGAAYIHTYIHTGPWRQGRPLSQGEGGLSLLSFLRIFSLIPLYIRQRHTRASCWLQS